MSRCVQKSHKQSYTYAKKFFQGKVCAKKTTMKGNFNLKATLKDKVDAKKTCMKGMHVENEKA